MVDRKDIKRWYYRIICLLILPCLILDSWGYINREQLMRTEQEPLWINIVLTIQFAFFLPAYVAVFRDLLKARWLFWTWIILHTAFFVFLEIISFF
jgi:hypothetical protein